jgi:hypothetical protein
VNCCVVLLGKLTLDGDTPTRVCVWLTVTDSTRRKPHRFNGSGCISGSMQRWLLPLSLEVLSGQPVLL